MRKKYFQLFATKLTERINNPSNAKEYCNSYLKWSKIITHKPKTQASHKLHIN